jgi:hypothetical protein
VNFILSGCDDACSISLLLAQVSDGGQPAWAVERDRDPRIGDYFQKLKAI